MEFSEHEQYLLRDWVVSQESARVGRKTTVACLQMENGYEVLGTSACVNPEEYDLEAGIYFATKDALKKVDEIVGYLRSSNSQWF
ncbi:Gp49 family protein [Cytobacillus oceanisediminis]|uniref:Gp49 family protein n=1 Tax=Cytobacillus oceanisediminis TaxID=665099 RepID=UPI001FB24BB8|nr:Gp49 family protein [Cytobacillus oceanisediminis]UOE58102.1 hypothetical protein IRB79_26695 [Cytobacillus oceanisediminis]